MRRESPQTAAEALVQHPAEMRFLVTFQHQPNGSISATESTNFSADIQAAGFVRAIIGDGVVNLAEQPLSSAGRFFVVVDRLTAGMPVNRIRESLEGAFAQGNGQAMVFVDCAEPLAINGVRRGTPYTIDGRVWQRLAFSNQMVCDDAAALIRRRSRGCTASTARWGVPGVRRLRQCDRHRSGSGRSRSAKIAARRGDRPVEHAGLRP